MPNVAIISYDFCKQNIRLQPWRYVYEIAKRLPNYGWDSVILTDSCADGNNKFAEISVRDSLHLSPLKINKLINTIDHISPDVILWPLGPKSFAYLPLFRKLKQRLIGYIPGPILNLTDLQAAYHSRLFNESLLAVLWMLSRVFRWGKQMSSCFERFIVLSESNRDAMVRMGVDVNRIDVITAGRDKKLQAYTTFQEKTGREKGKSRKKTALYMGWPKKVRGIDLLLDAFSIVSRRNKNLHLKILARGDGTKDHEKLHCSVKMNPARERITVVDGFLPNEEVLKHIQQCDFGVLPFIQVPADRPLSFLEFFEAGKPVVSTDATGILELIGDRRGIIANRLDLNSLADALLKMVDMEDGECRQYQGTCFRFADEYPSWDEIADRLARMLNES